MEGLNPDILYNFLLGLKLEVYVLRLYIRNIWNSKNENEDKILSECNVF